jgi:SAM-dependent methyltransferase
MTERAHPAWDASYAAAAPAPWDIGRPQPAFVRLADEGRLTGRLLDAGCGTGENALLAASRGADVTGIDVAPTAIARARAKASERGLTARFEVADALDLGRLGLTAGPGEAVEPRHAPRSVPYDRPSSRRSGRRTRDVRGRPSRGPARTTGPPGAGPGIRRGGAAGRR